MTTAWGSVRVCSAAAEHGGRGVLGPLYTEIAVAGTDGFFELKRSRDRKPSFE